MKKFKLCKNCQNWLNFNNVLIECDYDIFQPTKIEDGILFVPEQFDCPLYEDKRK